MSDVLSSHAHFRAFHFDSAVFQFDIDHRYHGLVVAALEIEKNEEVSLLVAERENLLSFLAGYRADTSATREDGFKGIAFRNLDLNTHLVAISVPKATVEFMATNLGLLMSGRLLTHFSVFLGPWNEHGEISMFRWITKISHFRVEPQK
jgi:hypothetical protein